jgi:hypothetical protein
MSLITDGLQGLGDLADKYLEYSVVKSQIDVETRQDDRNIRDRVDAYSGEAQRDAGARNVDGAVPWVPIAIGGAILLGLVIFLTVKS